MEQSKKMVSLIKRALEEKKAEELRIIDISKVSIMADYFMIASGNNRNQIQALSDHVEEELAKAGYRPKQIEGYAAANWVLLDYRDVIIHLFDSENRIFYDLERVWRDGRQVGADEFTEDTIQ